jgi:hypothetical protein
MAMDLQLLICIAQDQFVARSNDIACPKHLPGGPESRTQFGLCPGPGWPHRPGPVFFWNTTLPERGLNPSRKDHRWPEEAEERQFALGLVLDRADDRREDRAARATRDYLRDYAADTKVAGLCRRNERRQSQRDDLAEYATANDA